ncbi:hypothetical protein ABZ070_07555 [Streptomyces sp. NPDC006283]|uniref:hypothetical protein n=1 Tax=Streptomyces sp. NPDC006283 TaxID=3156741 RepID=UPI0033B59A9A
MTPRLRTRCAFTVASLLLLPAPLAHTEAQAAPKPSPKPSASASFAGRLAGEGRQRPGRVPAPDKSVSSSATPGRTPAAAVSHGASKSAAPFPPTRGERSRPGEREEDAPPGEEEVPETDLPAKAWDRWAPTPGRSDPAAARHQAPRSAPAPVAQQISPLSLGVGMALMGLGIGFLGVRLRRR